MLQTNFRLNVSLSQRQKKRMVSNNESIRNKSILSAELDQKLTELKEELFNLRFQHAINQLENPMRIKAVKKDIARINTVMRKD